MDHPRQVRGGLHGDDDEAGGDGEGKGEADLPTPAGIEIVFESGRHGNTGETSAASRRPGRLGAGRARLAIISDRGGTDGLYLGGRRWRIPRDRLAFPPMALSLRTRLGALLTLLCFFGAGAGASAVDSLLFHLGNHRDVPLDHIEAAGADCHAEGCLAGSILQDGRFLAAPGLGEVVRHPAEARLVPTARAVPAPQRRLLAALPRSPPFPTL